VLHDHRVDDTDPWDHFASTAREMNLSVGIQDTLDAAVHAAVQLIKPVESACVSLVRGRGRIETQAATDDMCRRADELQIELGEGPCLQAIRDEETVVVRDLTSEQRWPKWSSRAAEELGVRSMLCLQLFVADDDSIGALSLYSKQWDAFDDYDVRITALALAAHVAIAATSTLESDHLHSALASRTVIGQAQGMLIQRYELTPELAFAVLMRASQHSNRKLHVIAAEMVRVGIRPDLLQ
jgi:GAF domain-containing protein